MNNTSLGTISEKTGYIHYLASSYDQDVLLQIVPNGDGAVSTNYSVAAEDFSALFPACEISAVKADFAAEYNAYNDRSTTMEMVAMFHFDVTTPVAELKYVSAPTPAQARIVTADTDLNDNFASYMPSKDWNDLVGNNGNFSLYCSNYSSPKIERGEIVLPETATMTIYYSVNYPISVATTPVLSTSAEEAVPAKATTKDVVVAAPNAGYSGSFMGRFNVTADNFHGDVTMPSELCYKSNDDGSLTLFGPAGTKIYYKISKQEAPNLSASYRMTDDFVEAPTNPYTLEAEEIQGTFISSYTADAVTGDVIEEISMSVSEGGEVSGISDITIDGAASSKLYDLRGIEITDTPAAGIYIRRTGSLTEKVIIK
jgi:hypothetical protein